MNTIPTAPFPFVQNLAIMASAGTGKTYQLSMRFIALLLTGAKPEEIAALTFSRKAAGEILEDIVSNLMKLIREEKKRDQAVKDGFIPSGTTRQQLSRVLRDILSCRNKLHIETNDSFLFQIVQAAPAEFGIRGEIAMIDENDDRPRQRALLQTLHDPRFAGSDPEGKSRRNEIYRILRDISFGKNKPTLYGEITELLKNHYRAFLDFPGPEHWTLPGRRPSVVDGLSAAQLDDLRNRFDVLLEDAASRGILKDKRAVSKLVSLADCMKKVPKESFAWNDLKNSASLLAEYEKIRRDNPDMPETFDDDYTAVWNYYQENHLSGPLLRILDKWARHLFAQVFFALEKKTQAVFTLMALLDSSFSAQTRTAGKLSFADILYLINNTQKNDYGTLQVLRERLGMTIGHYLLDEFQDTSTSQWLAFKDLAEDVIQNIDPNRFTSFFMVGDIKQSIYQWRGGNPDLFMKICREQNFLPENGRGGDDRSEPGGLLKSLTCSHRSSEPVLRLVNDVFVPKTARPFPGRLKDQADIFIEQVKKMRFEPHSSGLEDEDRPEIGCSLVLSTQADDEKEHEEITWRTICALIKQLDPFSPRRKKPLSVAVLLRKNDDIRDCYEAMKRIAPELNVSREGSVALENSMAYAVFRQLLRLAAHPGDKTASAYLSMIRLPYGGAGLDTIRKRLFPGEEGYDLPRRIREELDQAGYGAFLQRFRSAFPETEQESEYMECLANALAAMETESLSPDERIALLDGYKVAQRSLSRTVQLMTIHKSKGLGFDIVILPFSETTPKHGGGAGIVEDEENGFCYFEPTAGFISQFPEIKANADLRLEKSIYELGCTVYVALTRAKRSTIVILPQEKPDSSAATLQPADILRRAGKTDSPFTSRADTDRFLLGLAPFFGGKIVPLTPICCAGDPFWTERAFSSGKNSGLKPSDREKSFRDQLRRAQSAEDFLPLAVFSRHPDSEASEAAPPSFHSFEIEPGARFLARAAADFGIRVHEILSELEWLGSEEDTKEFLRRFGDAPEAVRLLENALSKPDIANALRHPASGRVKLFREQPFLLRTGENESPVNGIIDRAAVEYDEAGNPVRAEIIDYKTDSADDPEMFRTNYRRQLKIYRRAMSELTGLPEPQITCTILALRPGLAIPL